MPLQYDVIIIGAGPAGSTAAILLARAGWSVALVEKQPFPRRKVCGECIAASNLPLLDALGLGDRIEACAGPQLRKVAVMQGKDTIVANLPAFDHATHAWGRALGRETLDTLLLSEARFAGAVILQPWSVRTVSGMEGAFSCYARAVNSDEGVVLRSPLVIAAHGSWESSPWSQPEHSRPSRPSDLLAFKANFDGAFLSAGLLPVLSFPGGYGGMVVADHGLLTIACCVRVDRLKNLRRALPGLSAGCAVGEMLKRECAGVAVALKGADRREPWLAAGPLHPGIHFKPTDTFFRIGNAAGEAHPIIGEGMSMAMQSAWMLCGHLIRSGGPRGLRSSARQRQIRNRYTAEWRRAFAGRLRLAAVFAHVAMYPSVLSPPFSLLRHFAPLLKYGAKLSGKVSSVLDASLVASLAAGTAGSPEPAVHALRSAVKRAS